MSEEAKVETEAKAADDASAEAIWNELTIKPDSEETPPGKVEEPGKEALAAPKVEAPAKADSSTAAADPWKDAPPELREAHERDLAEIRTRAEQAEITARRHSGRLSKQELELQALRAKDAPKGDASGAAEAAKTRDERMAKLREEFPEIADPILAELHAKDERLARVESVLSDQAKAHSDSILDEQASILSKAQPGWEADIKDNPKFVEWAVAQPEYIKGVIRENARTIVSGDDVADVIERYRRDTTDPEAARAEARRQEQLDAARGTDVRNPARPTPKGDGTVEQDWSDLTEQRRRREAGNRR